MARRKNSVKKDYVPDNDDERRQLIEQFLTEYGDDPESVQVHEAVPYEANYMVRSTSGRKGPKH
tara:strand:+ start:334 stop:525 length:192 start_codon:yes stop_codon:yes gene_type:complete